MSNQFNLLLKKVVPDFVIRDYRILKYKLEQKSNSRRTTEEVFSDIYSKNGWGSNQEEFCSGRGSIESSIVDPYIKIIADLSHSEGFFGKTFIDLGCGDFSVGKKLLPYCSNYIGIDIVEPLIEYNHKKYADQKVTFMHKDIINEELPSGDVCFIRQVLQHLSNQQIMRILEKARKFNWVIITEHYPYDNQSIVPNRDKTHGAMIRMFVNSGVYLTEKPFNIPAKNLKTILEVPVVEGRSDQGLLRTFIYKP